MGCLSYTWLLFRVMSFHKGVLLSPGFIHPACCVLRPLGYLIPSDVLSRVMSFYKGVLLSPGFTVESQLFEHLPDSSNQKLFPLIGNSQFFEPNSFYPRKFEKSVFHCVPFCCV